MTEFKVGDKIQSISPWSVDFHYGLVTEVTEKDVEAEWVLIADGSTHLAAYRKTTLYLLKRARVKSGLIEFLDKIGA